MDDYSLLCSICIETYRTPRLIKACGHSFCEQCLFTYVTTLKDKGELGSTFPCPVCRHEVTVPLDTDVTLSWIQTFSINQDLLDKLSNTPVKTPVEAENKSTMLCDPCLAENEQNRAVKFCVDCQERLCKECVAVHRKYKIFQNHKLYEVIEAELLKKFTDLSPAKCIEHTRDIELYCGMHKAYVCCKCVTLSHMECVGLVQISDMERTALKQLNSLKENFKESEKHIEDLISQNDSILSGLPNNRLNIMERLKTIRDKIVTAIDALIENAEVQTKQQLIGLEAELAAKTETLQDLKTKCHTQREMIDTVSEYGLPVHKVMTQSNISEEFVKLEKDIHINGQKMKSMDFRLKGMWKLEQLCGELQKSSKEQIKVVRKGIYKTRIMQYESDMNKSMMKEVLRKEVYTVGLVKKCHPSFTGITVMDDKHLLLTDNCDKQVHDWEYCYRTQDYYICDSFCFCGHVCLYDILSKSMTANLKMNKPFSAAVLKHIPGHIVVSVPKDKRLNIVSIKGNQMVRVKIIQCDKKPYSLISLDNGHVGVTWESPPSFSIVDLSGNEMKTVQSFTQDSTGRKFKSFQYVAVDELRSHIIQPCSKDNTVYCFDYAGNPVFEYKDPELCSPCGVDRDKNGFIYICSGGSGTVHVITPFGWKVNVFKDMPQCLQAISVEQTGDKFWCTSADCEKCYSFSFVE